MVEAAERLHAALESAGWNHPILDRIAGAMTHRCPTPLVARAAASPVTREAKVSVIVPCYKYGHFLPAALDSVLDQESVAVEVIVVDDASPDDSGAVADRLAEADSRVSVVHNPVNVGHVRAFNRGYERATGEFVVRLDADDLLTPGSLSRAVALFDAYPSVGLVYGHPLHFTTETPPPARPGSPAWTVWAGGDWVRERCRRGVNCITTPEAMIRASVMDEVGALNTNLHYAQDMEMWLRAAAASDVGHVDNVDQAFHRDHAASMSMNEGSGHLVDIQERRTVFSELFATVGERFPDREELDRSWRATLAAEALREVQHAHDRGRLAAEDARALYDFALDVAGAGAEAAWRRVHVPTPRRRTPFASARATRRRLRDELAYLRWSRTGL